LGGRGLVRELCPFHRWLTQKGERGRGKKRRREPKNKGMKGGYTTFPVPLTLRRGKRKKGPRWECAKAIKVEAPYSLPSIMGRVSKKKKKKRQTMGNGPDEPVIGEKRGKGKGGGRQCDGFP